MRFSGELLGARGEALLEGLTGAGRSEAVTKNKEIEVVGNKQTKKYGNKQIDQFQSSHTFSFTNSSHCRCIDITRE